MTTKEMFGNNLRMLRNSKGLTTDAAAKLLGVAKSTLHYWETGISQPIASTLDKICKLYEVQPIDLYSPHVFEIKDMEDFATFGKIPVYSSIAAGKPISANEDIVDYVDIPSDWLRRNNYFAIKVRGNSMFPTINDGDTVIIRQQEDADSGKICVVMINGYDATLKKIKKMPEGVWILPINPDSEYKPTFYTNDEIEKLPILIVGVAVEIRRTIN